MCHFSKVAQKWHIFLRPCFPQHVPKGGFTDQQNVPLFKSGTKVAHFMCHLRCATFGLGTTKPWKNKQIICATFEKWHIVPVAMCHFSKVAQKLHIFLALVSRRCFFLCKIMQRWLRQHLSLFKSGTNVSHCFRPCCLGGVSFYTKSCNAGSGQM